MIKRRHTVLLAALVFTIILHITTGAMATEQEHDHNWVLQGGGSRGHSYMCDGCGQSKLEDHTLDSSEICTICGYYQHTHNWQYPWADDQFHNMVCSGCGEEKTITHSKDNAGVCTVCGYRPHEHVWQYNGKCYDEKHGLQCTKCASTSMEEHSYGSDGKCTVCGSEPPHKHQYVWDGNKSNYVSFHFMICSCGDTTTENHRLFKWDGKAGAPYGHNAACGVCGFSLLVFDHEYDDAYYNGERCTVCGYPGQPTTGPGNNSGGAIPEGTRPPETEPEDTTTTESEPAGTEPKDTASAETEPTETEPEDTTTVETTSAEIQAEETESTEGASTETKPTSVETTPQNAAKENSQNRGSVWVLVVGSLVIIGCLGAVVFFAKKKSK